MRTLIDFQAPLDGEITLCEVNGHIHSMNFEFANVNTFTKAVEKHPHIHLSRNSLHPLSTGDEGKALFLPVDVPFLKQIVQIYYEHGLTHALHVAASQHRGALSLSASVLLKAVKYVEKFTYIYSNRNRRTDVRLLSDYSQSRGWSRNPVRCFAWHPYSTKIAVAGLDDIVRIYSTDMSFVPLLKCKQQRNITCLAWRPMSVSDVAVACENEIIVWNVDPTSVVTRPSINNAIILYRIQHRSVMSLAWSPRGDVLASAATCDATVFVWDVEMDRVSHLKCPGYSGNVLLKWSPTGDRLFSGSDGLVFRVWDCRSWLAERWTLPTGRIQSACWSATGSFLLFATNLEPTIYGLTFTSSDTVFVSEKDNSPNLAVALYDLNRVDLDGIVVGGAVQSMDIDPKDNHLAVVFHDSDCIAVFNVHKLPVLRLTASTLISGMPEEKPSSIEFQKNFKHGTCLTIAWSSGRIQHFPIIYEDSLTAFNNTSVHNNSSINYQRSFYTSF